MPTMLGRQRRARPSLAQEPALEKGGVEGEGSSPPRTHVEGCIEKHMWGGTCVCAGVGGGGGAEMSVQRSMGVRVRGAACTGDVRVGCICIGLHVRGGENGKDC